MPTKEATLQILRLHFPHLRDEYGLSRLSLTGSVARGTATADSDVDVIAEFDRPIGLRFMEFAERLETVLGSKVDVLTPDGVASIRIPHIAASLREAAIDVRTG
ncbi:MAG: nucleotidyltransferase domain-containing protein [Candidatus Latescibacterota bacterium]